MKCTLCKLKHWNLEAEHAECTVCTSRLPKGPNLEKIQSRLKFSISLENFATSLEIFNLDLQKSPQKLGVGMCVCVYSFWALY